VNYTKYREKDQPVPVDVQPAERALGRTKGAIEARPIAEVHDAEGA
jgi:hypothetical protein